MVSLSLDWIGELSFRNSAGSPAIDLRSSTPGFTSPTQALAYALMGCMAMDVVDILQRGRQDIRGLTTTFEGERATEAPRRWLKMSVHFDIRGSADPHAIERAIELSRTKYCSVWHTLKPDIDLQTSYRISTD